MLSIRRQPWIVHVINIREGAEKKKKKRIILLDVATESKRIDPENTVTE